MELCISHLPSDSTLLSSCVFKLRVSLFTTAIFRCFCAGNDAQRFNFVPVPLLAPIDVAVVVVIVDDRIRLPMVPCISLCDTERWTCMTDVTFKYITKLIRIELFA